MTPQPAPDDRPVPAILRAVPPAARSVLYVGRRPLAVGWRVTKFPSVFAVEHDDRAGVEVTTRPDGVITLDVGRADIPLPDGAVDCVAYDDILPILADPEVVLRQHRRLLTLGGLILGSFPNAQHHCVVAALLRGEPPAAGFFTYVAAFRLLLDAGYAPDLVADTTTPSSPEFLAAAAPLLHHLHLHPGRTRRYLDAARFVVRGVPLADADVPPGPAEPITVVCCVSDDAVLGENLLRSPDLTAGTPHEILLVRGSPSAADGLNLVLDRGRHDLVIGIHQDVYLPRGWVGRFARRVRDADAVVGPVGVAGVYGAVTGPPPRRVGRVVDRDRLLWEPAQLPAAVDTLDELVLAVRRGSGLRFDLRLGWHFYGADVCLATRERGLAAAAVDAVCLHNSRSVGLPADFRSSGAAFGRKWRASLPVATSCVLVEPGGRMREW